MQIEFHQWDWLPGFAAFLDTGGKLEKHPDAKAFCILNLGSTLGMVAAGDAKPSEIPYFIAESMMHEIIHALEKWAGVQFSEERVEALIHKYRVSRGLEPPDSVFEMPPDAEPTVTIPLSDYKRLLEASEGDDMIVTCEVCGAWLDRDDKGTATVDDFTGCWKAAAGLEDVSSCRSYRAHVMLVTGP